ncbi:hypothetical protein [Brevibacillus massiliensis]|uniref:hypothetical protein n=1 Tax=Brevibacillus massiliensis TaxID=1118054 RepID=UPI00037ADDA7|nr:hypothetical protein [Brevibacillus massiliensis]
MVYRVSLRLRSSDKKLAAWLDEHKNKNEAILDALNQFLFDEESHNKDSDGPPSSSDPPEWATELQQTMQQLLHAIMHLDSKMNSRTVENRTAHIGLQESQSAADHQQVTEEEPRFRDLAKGILNF